MYIPDDTGFSNFFYVNIIMQEGELVAKTVSMD